jgi:hypothetical protein
VSPQAPATAPPIVRFKWSYVGAAVAFVTGCVGLAFTLWPGLIPDPRGVLAAKLAVESVEPHVRLASYLRRFDPGELKTLESGEGTLPGYIVYVRVKIEGRKHGNIILDDVTYGWKSQRPFDEEGTPTLRGFHPGTTNDSWIAPVWVADPRREKDFFVRLRLFDDNDDENDVLLAFADTPRLKAPPAAKF